MSKVLVTESNLQDIADAIRSKNEGTDTYRPGDMAAAILAIPTGGGSTLVSKTITQNGEYDPEDDNADGYSDVTVNVPNSYAAGDEGKVVSSGALVAQTSTTVTQNGTYDTTENNEVVVNVSGGGGAQNILYGDELPTANVGNNGDMYLQTTPAGVKNAYGQYIDTEYSGNANSKYIIDFKFDKAQSSQWVCPFGGRPNPGSVNSASLLSLAISGGNLTETSIQWGSDGIIATGWPGAKGLVGKIIHAEISAGLAKMSVDGNQLTNKTWTPTTVTDTTHIGLFAALANNEYQGWSPMDEMVLYRFQIYENDTLIHDFVPATDANNVVCIKDNVTGNYKYPNSGALTSVPASDNIMLAYAKVNGSWQDLIGTDINDVNTGANV